MNKILRYFLLLVITAFLSSCITNKKLNYLQTPEQIQDTTNYTITEASPYILRAGDELYIDVKPLSDNGSEAFQTGASKGTSSRVTSSSAYFYTYPIYENGTINYPYIGSIQAADLTLEEFREQLNQVLSEYVEGIITVKLASNYINVLGEVSSPGRKEIKTEKLNIFEALALAGDLDPYAKRAEVKIIRETKEGPIIKTFDIRNENIINSEYYWIQPGDIIYVSRIKGQFFKMDSFSDFVTVFSSSLSLILLSISFSNIY